MKIKVICMDTWAILKPIVLLVCLCWIMNYDSTTKLQQESLVVPDKEEEVKKKEERLWVVLLQ